MSGRQDALARIGSAGRCPAAACGHGGAKDALKDAANTGRVMGRNTDRLGQLARIARVKADGELRTYSARRAQADAMQRQVDAVRDELRQAIASPGSDALEQWRRTTALVGYRSEQLQQAEAALTRIRPGLETARQAAIRAFGRAEALTQLQALTRAQIQLDRQRRGG